MDDRPFFVFSMDTLKANEIKTIEKFSKSNFDIEKIVQEAGNLKTQSVLRKEIEKEFLEPSEDFVRMLASRVHEGRVTQVVKDNIARMIPSTISMIVRDLVNERLSSALNAATPDPVAAPEPEAVAEDAIVTTQEELSGFYMIQAIASRLIDPKRVSFRDAKSYCAILLDDNNRKTIARLHFNGVTTKYVGTFSGKIEQRHLISDLTQIYMLSQSIEDRLRELLSSDSDKTA